MRRRSSWPNLSRAGRRATMFLPPWFGNPWVALAVDTASLSLDAQQVIMLRLARLAAGRGSHAEMMRMAMEKPVAFAAAQIAAAAAVAGGHKDHVAARKALGVYAKAVRANRRRLGKG